MRGSTYTIKPAHMTTHIPSMRDVKRWAEKASTRERKTDAALLGTTIILFGWLLYCLDNAFRHYQILM